MLKFALLLLIPAIPVFCLAQTHDNIKDWQIHHPEVVFIESSHFSTLSSEEQALFGSNVILFDQEIRWEDIQKYEDNHKPIEDPISDPVIKEWLAAHPDVKLIPSSYFNTLSEEQKEKYLQHNALILEGEVITIKDTERYENQ